jgi:sec-independent protein translocase protein TatB
MFVDLSWSHILLVLVVALVVVGPKDLPRLMREVGRWAGRARAMADQFRRSFDEMARQSELDELRREIDELRATRPLADAQRQLSEPILPPDLLSRAVPADEPSPVPADAAPPLPEPAPAADEKTPAP